MKLFHTSGRNFDFFQKVILTSQTSISCCRRRRNLRSSLISFGSVSRQLHTSIFSLTYPQPRSVYMIHMGRCSPAIRVSVHFFRRIFKVFLLCFYFVAIQNYSEISHVNRSDARHFHARISVVQDFVDLKIVENMQQQQEGKRSYPKTMTNSKLKKANSYGILDGHGQLLEFRIFPVRQRLFPVDVVDVKGQAVERDLLAHRPADRSP